MANPIQVSLQLILKKLDEILKVVKLGRRSSNRAITKEETEKILNEQDIFLRKEQPSEDKSKSISQDKFNTAMKNVMHWVNKKDNDKSS